MRVVGTPPVPRWTVVLAASTILAAGMTARAAPLAGAEAGLTAVAAARPVLSVRVVDGLRAAAAASRADADPTQQAIPEVKAAVRAERMTGRTTP